MDDLTTTTVTLLRDLDDACLCCVLAHLPSATDLVRVQAVCRRLRSVGLNNKLWINWLYEDFGLPIGTASSRTTSCASPKAGAAQQFYGKLRTQECPRSLHATAISTDGGCDEPYEAYWADNMFTCKQAVMYCSQSDTTNVHVVARLNPKHALYSPSTHQLPGLVEPMTEAQRRSFTLDRCVQVAVKLIHSEAYAAGQAQQQKQQQPQVTIPDVGTSHALAGAASGQQEQGGPLGRLLKRFVGATADTDKAVVVRRILDDCSTEGLVEFFLECFIAQVHNRPWAEDLYKGLDEQGRQMARWMAFLEYERKPEPRAEYKLVSLPLPSQSAAAPAAGSSTAAAQQEQEHRSRQHQQQQQHLLLCDEAQSNMLMQSNQPGQDTSIIHQCIIARDGLGGSTCPVSSGLLYLGHYCNTISQHSHHTTSAANEAASATYNSAELASEIINSFILQQAAAVLSDFRHQAWVSASDNLVTAAAVFSAVDAGRLPAVLDYACNEQAEWIEFKQPSREQLVQQLHQQDLGTDTASSAADSRVGCGAVMCPVLWFRFHPTGVQDDEQDPDDDADYMFEEPEQPEQADNDVDAMGLGGAAAVSDSFVEEDEEFASISDAAQQEQQTEHGLVQHETGTEESGPATACAMADTATSLAAGAVGAPVPRSAPSTAICEAIPALPVLATEVAAALGYLPTHPQHKGYLAVQLQQPRSGNMMCVKLLNCEDVKPEFNKEKGGCNIDIQLVLLRGHDLGKLPDGLVVTGVQD